MSSNNQIIFNLQKIIKYEDIHPAYLPLYKYSKYGGYINSKENLWEKKYKKYKAKYLKLKNITQ